MSDELFIDGAPLSSIPGIKVVEWSMPISREMAMDYGLIPDDRLPRKPISRRTKLRWWLSAHRPVLHLGPCNHDDCDY